MIKLSGALWSIKLSIFSERSKTTAIAIIIEVDIKYVLKNFLYM